MSDDWLKIIANGFKQPQDMKGSSLAVGLVLGATGATALIVTGAYGGFAGLLTLIFGVVAVAIVTFAVLEFM